MPEINKHKTVSESLTEYVQILMPQHTNGLNKLFGGQLMQWIDIVAGVVARRHSEYNVTTAAIDNLQFKKGAQVNDTIVLIGKITFVGSTSMEVRVDTYVEDFSGVRISINRAYLVMVAIDENNHPIKVPRLILENECEKAEWEGGVKRREFRKSRYENGF
jgi:acyl-CoA hydrolase